MNKFRKLDDWEILEIKQFIEEDECSENFNCNSCSDAEYCYMESNTRCNNEFAESIDYGGYDNAEQFWENLYG